MTKSRILLVLAMAAAMAAYFAFDLDRYLTLEFFKSRQADIAAWVTADTLRAGIIFFTIYVAVTALSVPGAAIMTLAAGAMFGLLWGTFIVSFASSIGATLAFLASRFLLRDAIQTRFRDRLSAVNRGVAADGAYYLLTLRLVPAFPFFIVNLVMGLTHIRTWTFYWVSQAGMLAGTLVYVNAGTEIARIESLSGILSPGLIISFVLLGVFPLIAKWLVGMVQIRRVYASWKKPCRFDRNVIVIGGGSAGLVTAYIAAAVKASVTLVEKHRMGGDCLNTGCVPSKALIRSAQLVADMRRAAEFGIRAAPADFDFADVMERVQRVVRTVEPHDSVARYTALGVECLTGEAKIISPWEVRINGKTLTTRNIVIAAGARPRVPPIPGIDQVDCLTSETVWQLRKLPKRMVVLGGGPIGCELAQCFSRLGSNVTQIEMHPRLLMREDPDIAARVEQRLRAEGVTVLTGHRATEFKVVDGIRRIICKHDGLNLEIEFDVVLCALGRVANTAGYGLEELRVPLTKSGTIATNRWLQTIYPNIYACGDVAGPYQFTHAAAHQAWYAAVNALFGSLRRFAVDYRVMPWATFTDPEVARVGLNESEAIEKNIAHEVTTFDIAELDRAIADEAASGVVKVLTAPGSDRILGVTIVGAHAGNLIAEFVLAMRHNIGLNRILGTIHIYPTLAEANKYAAGAWKRARVTRGQTRFLAALHAWRRGAGGLPAVLARIPGLLSDRRPAQGMSAHPPEQAP